MPNTTVFSPSTASGYIKLKSNDSSVTDAYAELLAVADADGGTYPHVNFEMFDLYALTITNKGPNTLANVLLEHSADGINWSDSAITYFDGLPSGESRSLENTDNAKSLLRVRGKCGAGETCLVDVTLEGRVIA